MSIRKTLKSLLILPLRRSAETIKVGQLDSWSIIEPDQPDLFMVSAGVGHSVSFEQDFSRRWQAKIVILDPSPTGIETMSKQDFPETVDFLPIGLAEKDGLMGFVKPLRAEEGSFSIASQDSQDTINFECRSLTSIMNMYSKSKINVLKMDIEGFEYSVIEHILTNRIEIDQICLEIHTHHGSGSSAGLFDAARLIIRLYLAGYRIIFNTAMDFTFCHNRLLAN